ncbi:MAG: 30S ribosomal protein S1 [Deltaproteobacteria bacterium]|nr:30S ribosomal protein S1 [Deltaproteobacteria bacterium]
MTYTTEEFGALFEESLKTKKIETGSLVKGKIVKVSRDYVFVDIGFKSEGQIPIHEFKNMDGEVVVTEGDPVDVVFESVENAEGLVELSKEKADALHAWDELEVAERENRDVEGVVISKIKGGMVVNVGGVRAFLPGSQIDLKPVKSLDRLLGKKFNFKILKLNKQKSNVVLSRRAILEKEREAAKTELLKNIKEGQVVEGHVKNVTDYGAFIDLGGVDGLLHITDMTWGRIAHPSEVVSVGQQIKVVVLKFDENSHKVSLGLKQLLQDPWEKVLEKFPVGTRVQGRVVNVTDYGAFIEIEEGFEGLVHISEMTWSKKVKHPSKIVSVGDRVTAMVLSVDVENRRISLGMKQIEPNPWDSLAEKYPIGQKVKGVAKNITDFGVFVGIEEDIDGLVHISDFSWNQKFKHPNDLYKKGDEIEAVILNIDKENERISLGIKQLPEDLWQVINKKFEIDNQVKGKVAAIDSKGFTIDLGDPVDAFIPMNQFDGDAPKVGDEIDMQVIQIDEKERKIILSVRALSKFNQKKAFADFKSKQSEVKATFSDIMKPKNE